MVLWSSAADTVFYSAGPNSGTGLLAAPSVNGPELLVLALGDFIPALCSSCACFAEFTSGRPAGSVPGLILESLFLASFCLDTREFKEGMQLTY